jgi:hypothetical protein
VDGRGDGTRGRIKGTFFSDTTRLGDNAWGMHIGAEELERDNVLHFSLMEFLYILLLLNSSLEYLHILTLHNCPFITQVP